MNADHDHLNSILKRLDAIEARVAALERKPRRRSGHCRNAERDLWACALYAHLGSWDRVAEKLLTIGPDRGWNVANGRALCQAAIRLLARERRQHRLAS